MKVLHVSEGDISGGAARAAYRLHRALLNHGKSSRMKVRSKKSDDWTIDGPVGKIAKAMQLIRPLGNRLMGLQSTSNVNPHSGNFLPSRWAQAIDSSPADVINLHWVAGETLSIEDLGRITKPIVWTLHDMWAFCGTEHFAADDEGARWRMGYQKTNRGTEAGGLDLDRLVGSANARCGDSRCTSWFPVTGWQTVRGKAR